MLKYSMKYAAALCLLILVFLAGYFFRGGDKYSEYETYEEVSLKESELKPISKNPENKINKTNKKYKNKTDYKKELVYYMDKVPFHFVATRYRQKREALEKLAFSGELDKGEYGSDKRENLNRNIFNEVLPTLKEDKYYSAEGSFTYKNIKIPFESIFSYIRYYDEDRSIPLEYTNFEPTIKLRFDLSQFNSKEKVSKMDVYMDYGINSFFIQDGSIYVRHNIYGTELPLELRDIQAFLLGAPNSLGSSVSLRLFSTDTKSWIEVSNDIFWRSIDREDFLNRYERLGY